MVMYQPIPKTKASAAGSPPPQTHKERRQGMATKTSQGSESRVVMDVDWNTVADPLDVTVTRNGAKVPRRKVRVRGIVGDDWLEQEAVLDRGAVRRLVAAIRKLARHGYEARLANSIRFVHMYDSKDGLYLSPQLLNPFKDEVLKGVDFRLMFEGQQIGCLDEARGQAQEGDEAEAVTPDPMVECPACHKRFRIGKRQG